MRMFLRVEAEAGVIDALFGLIKPSDGTAITYGRLPDEAQSMASGAITRHRTMASGGLPGMIATRFGMGLPFTLDDARKYAMELGCQGTSASGALSDLVKHGFAHRSGQGHYTILKTVPPGYHFNKGPA